MLCFYTLEGSFPLLDYCNKHTSLWEKIDLNIRKAFELFVRKVKVRNLSSNTLKTYKWHYDAFSRYTDVENSIETITKNDVDGFIL